MRSLQSQLPDRIHKDASWLEGRHRHGNLHRLRPVLRDLSQTCTVEVRTMWMTMQADEPMNDAELRCEIESFARSLGATLVRTCPTDRWSEIQIQDRAYWPRTIWPWAETAVVMGVPLPAAMVATTPSMVYQELYDTTNRTLDDMAYRVATYLTEKGRRAVFFPRDCYFNIEALLDNPAAAFSHVLAGYYSGMGTIGDSHNLITPEYGPRVRIVTVLTDAILPYDDVLTKDLCIHCGKCLRECPSKAFSRSGDGIYDMDKDACTRYHIDLTEQRHWPCGRCIAVCPVGEDLRPFRGSEIVSDAGKEHCRTHGS